MTKETTKDAFEKQYNVQIENYLNNDFMKFKHIFSHLTWEMECNLVQVQQLNQLPANAHFLPIGKIRELPMSVPMLKILNVLN